MFMIDWELAHKTQKPKLQAPTLWPHGPKSDLRIFVHLNLLPLVFINLLTSRFFCTFLLKKISNVFSIELENLIDVKKGDKQRRSLKRSHPFLLLIL